MRRWFVRAALWLAVLGIGGCFDDSASKAKVNSDVSTVRAKRPPPPPPPPPPTIPMANAGGSVSSQPRPAATPRPAAPLGPSPETAPNPPPAAASQQPIQLATGVALAQTTLEGTVMMFSVDYEVTQGEPNPAGYIWVIERARGAAARLKFKLTAKGTLPAALNWRPEDGPFHSHLEDRKGNRVSESIEMQQSGA